MNEYHPYSFKFINKFRQNKIENSTEMEIDYNIFGEGIE